MCGIAGIVAQSGRKADADAAMRMAEALVHRGPDGSGHWSSADARVAFAHRRLAIIDLDARASQPMVDAAGRIAVVFNGEIYNHAALRRRLQAAGHPFRTVSSDTEVLLEGYRAWGIEGLLERLDGIFSFALHDSERNLTHLVRDRFGIKPLYVAWHDRPDGTAELLFASELRAIAARPGWRAAVDAAQFARYLTFMSVPAPATVLAGVWKVPAGCRLDIGSAGQASLLRYYEPAAAPAARARDRGAIVAELRALFADVVTAQMVADVPVGILLSGGLDSGAILAAASQQRRGIDAFTVAFTDDPGSDESALAAQTARRYGARHHIEQVSPQDATEHLDDVIAAMDEPQADWVCVPMWFLARAVADRSMKVVLVGEGADELFVGYEHWRTYLGRIARWGVAARRLAPLARLASPLLARLAGARLSWRVRADFLARAARGRALFWGGAILCWPAVLDVLLRAQASLAHGRGGPRWSAQAVGDTPAPWEPAVGCVEHWYRAIEHARPQADAVERMIALEFRQRLPELLLMRVDKMMMAHGVEARVPFLARALVEFAATIPSGEKLGGVGTKALLREAFADLLPPAVLSARKRGFGAPVARWLRGPFGERAREQIRHGPLAGWLSSELVARLFDEHRAGRADHAAYLWALFVLGRWIELSGASLQG